MSAAEPLATPPDLAPLRFSRLKLMAKSPAHVRHALDQDIAGNDSFDDTASKRLGRLAHAVLLGQPLPVVFPGERRQGNAWKDFQAEHAGREIVKQSELDSVKSMVDVLHANDDAVKILTGERIEQTSTFTMLGRLCRMTPDSFTPGAVLGDYKSATDASPERFPWQAIRLCYHGQLTFYKDGAIACGFKPPSELIVVAQETKPPYPLCIFPLTERAEDLGRRTYRLWFERFLVCESANTWPAYGYGVIDANDPAELADADENDE